MPSCILIVMPRGKFDKVKDCAFVSLVFVTFSKTAAEIQKKMTPIISVLKSILMCVVDDRISVLICTFLSDQTSLKCVITKFLIFTFTFLLSPVPQNLFHWNWNPLLLTECNNRKL